MGLVLRRLMLAVPVAALLALGACASTPSHFYLLNPLSPS